MKNKVVTEHLSLSSSNRKALSLTGNPQKEQVPAFCILKNKDLKQMLNTLHRNNNSLLNLLADEDEVSHFEDEDPLPSLP